MPSWDGLERGDPVATKAAGFFTFHGARMDGDTCLWVEVIGGRTDRVRGFRFFPPEDVTRLANTKKVRQRKADAERRPAIKPSKRRKGAR